MDPEHEIGILGGVGRSGGEAARSRRKPAVHAAMNGEDAVERGGASLLAAERQLEHGAHREVEAPRGRESAVSERTVIGDAGRNERMRELQQDGPRPSEQDDALGVDAAGEDQVTRHKAQVTI